MARSGQRTQTKTAPARGRSLEDAINAAVAGERVEIRAPQHRAAIAGFWDALARRIMYDDRQFFGSEALFTAYCLGFKVGCDHVDKPLAGYSCYMSDDSDPAPYMRARQGQATVEDMVYINERNERSTAEHEKRRSARRQRATVGA